MNGSANRLLAVTGVGLVAVCASATTLVANPGPANNGGSAGWAMFFDLTTGANAVNVTGLTTASTAAANSVFNIEVFTRAGTALGGPVGSGPGSSSAGWTSLGIASATQGAVSSAISLLVDIPDISVASNSTVGVALRFTVAGPRYFGTGTPAYSTYSDSNLTLKTGDGRSAPFTTTGSFFASRAMVGSLEYTAVPEPATMLVLAGGVAALIRRRRKA